MKKRKLVLALLVFILAAILAVFVLFFRYIFMEAAGKEERTGSAKEAAFSPFIPAEHKGTFWQRKVAVDKGSSCSDYEYLLVFDDGEMELKHGGVVYRVVENDAGMHLEKDMFASPFDTEPAISLQAGEISFSVSGETLRIEARTDPLGLFTDFSTDDLLLERESWEKSVYTGRVYTGRTYDSDPHFQPYTDWYCEGGGVKNGEAFRTQSWFETSLEGTVSGKIRFADHSEENCELLWAEDAGAIVRTGSRELLFFGSCVFKSVFSDDGEDFFQYTLVPRYDPYGLGAGHYYSAKKQADRFETEPTDILGMDVHTIKGRLAEGGWKWEPLSAQWDDNATDDYGELLLKFTKNDSMLVVILDGYQYAIEYLLLGPEGDCESWGCMRPGDHTLAEAFRPGDEYPFEFWGFDGLMEDDAIMLLDDGRVFITYWQHEGSWGVLNSFLYDPKTLTRSEILKK